ncbi:MAG: putative nucleotidyltransferase substrate binding domain-containing protein, partial [Acidimicrobiales bacterium]
LGLVTDSDLRSRLVAQGLDPETPISEVMTAPALTVTGDRPGAEVLLDMLDHGFRHFPVLAANGRVLGVVEDHDLVAAQGRSSFLLRRAVARATSAEELARAGASLRAGVIEMHHGGVAVLDVMSVYSVVADALTRRAIELEVAAMGVAPTPFAWLCLGSQARREALPSSDLDSALAWRDVADEAPVRGYLATLATRVTDVMAICGFAQDDHRVSAADALFSRSVSSWHTEARRALDDPTGDKALIIASVLTDSRVVWGMEFDGLLGDQFAGSLERPLLLRLLARFALSHRPPSGFARGMVVDSTGDGHARLDLKSAAVVPIVGLARWAGLRAGVTSASTSARLRAARDAGILTDDDARSLLDAFELVCQLRLENQVTQMEGGHAPDDLVDPSALSPLTRAYLKEAFRAVAAVQHRVANEIAWRA